MGVRINPTTQFQPASHVRRFKILNAMDYYHVWGYMKAMACAHKVSTREEVLRQILSAARSINNAAVLRKVTSPLVTRVRKYIQADRGHLSGERRICNSTFNNIAQ